MKNWRIETNGYGVYYRHAASPAAAKQRVVYALFGRGYAGYEHDYWTVREADATAARKRGR